MGLIRHSNFLACHVAMFIVYILLLRGLQASMIATISDDR